MMNYNTVDILLVEDNPNDAELSIRELKKNNLANNLFHVKDGAEALDFIFAEGQYTKNRDVGSPPKLIIMDIQMPKVNGIEVLERLKSDERTKATPVIMLSSSRENPDIAKCYSLGANSYIVKPLNFEGFAEAIRNLSFYWLLLNEPPVK
jgi:two-component system response regulator